MTLGAFELRPAVPDDAPAMAAITAEGFETYRSFTPPGWQPWRPTADETRERFWQSGAWAVVAESEGEVVGVGAYVLGREARVGPIIPGLAHVAAVFVTESWWGTGVAAALLERLVEQMRSAGFEEARLYTPVGQARARAFYSRERWQEVSGPLPAPEVGLDMIELRRRL
jgi:GNAT superfamily N-acetyltransferase